MRRILGGVLAGLVTLAVAAPAAHADRYRRGGYRGGYGGGYRGGYSRHGHGGGGGVLGGLIIGGALGYVIGRESSRDRYYPRDRYYDDGYYRDRSYRSSGYYDRGYYDDCPPTRRVYERRIIEEDYYRPSTRRYDRYDY